MNDMTQQMTQPLARRTLQSDLMTRELERLWLLSALKVGLDQIGEGHSVLADDGFFETMDMRLFGNGQEQVIEA